MFEVAAEPLTTTGPPSWEAGGMKCRVELHYRWGAHATDATRSAAGEALIGHLEFPIRQLIDSPGRCLATRLEPAGRLAVRGILVTAGLHQQARIRLRASLSAAGTSATPQPATSASYFFTVSREIGSSASALSPSPARRAGSPQHTAAPSRDPWLGWGFGTAAVAKGAAAAVGTSPCLGARRRPRCPACGLDCPSGT